MLGYTPVGQLIFGMPFRGLMSWFTPAAISILMFLFSPVTIVGTAPGEVGAYLPTITGMIPRSVLRSLIQVTLVAKDMGHVSTLDQLSVTPINSFTIDPAQL